jgi:type II secretory pathway pseudopilin PulG
LKRRRRESGFVLLLVFLMAAVIAISLYMEIPRIAFEAQRQKEQLLIERGEQYKRAIQVFYTTNKRYPARIEELESLNNRRFLRRRYIDPMTGKDEWRLVHIQNGVLTDSVDSKQKKKDDKDQTGNSGQYVAELGGIGQTPAGAAQGGVALANRRRASDGGAGGATPGGATPGASNMPGVLGLNGQPNPGAPGYGGTLPPGAPGGPPGPPGLPGVQVPGQPGSSNSNAAGGGNSIGSGAYVGGGYGIGSQPTTPGTPGTAYPGQGMNPQTGAPSAYPMGGGAPGMMPGGAPGMMPGGQNPQAQNAAAAMIQQILTQPRPGGMPTTSQTAMGGGIAGVASKADDDSIMVYNDHTNYGDWEYVFDYSKYRAPPNPLQGAQGTPASQLGSTPGSPLGTPVGQPAGSPFGQSSGSSFGQTPGTPPSPSPIPR